MTQYDNTTYHIYLKDRCVYWNLNEEDFEEKWQMLNVMVDLSYIKLGPKCGVGGPGKVVTEQAWEEDSY